MDTTNHNKRFPLSPLVAYVPITTDKWLVVVIIEIIIFLTNISVRSVESVFYELGVVKAKKNIPR